MNEDSQGAQLQWPQSPEKARIRYIMAVKGFRETGTTLKGVLFGKKEGMLLRPIAVAAGPGGRLAVADELCRCVHLYVPSEKQYQRIDAARDERMVSPVGLTFDDESRLYVSDSSLGKVLVFDAGGEYLFAIEKAGRDRLKRPTGIAFNNDKKVLYVVDTLAHRVDVFDRSGVFLFSFGERGTGNGQFNFPTHIFWKPGGMIYITDAMNFRIQMFDESGVFIAAFGRHGDGSGDFAVPKGVAVDRDNIVYVVDSLLDNVQLFNQKGDFLLTLGGRGSAPGEFWLPSGISIDGSDRIYVCDTFNQRVQVFQIRRETSFTEENDSMRAEVRK
jgi:sugar lactone lactonase YvrE